jgi:VIT1/CCC1 family predicted Fe2+/Mn2+ transporter
MKWAGVVAAISFAFGVIIGLQAYSLGMNLLLAAPATACVLLGGYAGARRNQRP